MVFAMAKEFLAYWDVFFLGGGGEGRILYSRDVVYLNGEDMSDIMAARCKLGTRIYHVCLEPRNASLP